MSIATRGIVPILKQALAQNPGPMDLAVMAKPFETDTIAGEIDTLGWIGHIPGFRLAGEKNQNADLAQQKLDIRILDFRSSWRLKGSLVRNSKIGPILAEKSGEWGRRRIDLMNQLVADRVNNAETQLAYDGKSFYAPDHSVNNSGAINNDITSPAVSASAPTTHELSLAILAGLSQFFTFKDDQSLPLYRPMTVIDVTVNTAVVGKVAAAVGLNSIDTGAGSIDNPLLGLTRAMGITLRVKTNPLITIANTKIQLINASPGTAPFLLGENPAEKRVTELDETSDLFKNEDMYAFNAFWAGASAYGEFTDAVLVTLVNA